MRSPWITRGSVRERYSYLPDGGLSTRQVLASTAMNAWIRILLGVAAGALVGFVTGRWGSSGGLAAMFAGLAGVALLPLLSDWVAKRSRKRQRDSRHLP
jgi:membrane associated rhomboid family serine protease